LPHQDKNNEDDVDNIIHATAPTGNGLYRLAYLVPAAPQMVFQDNRHHTDGDIFPIVIRWFPTCYRQHAYAIGHWRL
jgi:hypothetical protein